MKCPTCGAETSFQKCAKCTLLENHIDKYLESREGLHFILNKMNVIQMRRELEKRGLTLDGTNK